MTRARVATALVVALIAAGFAASCLVDNRTGDFACSGQADCGAGRLCQSGYCLLVEELPPDGMQCPAPCTACDFDSMSCEVVCDSAQACNNITCPAGFECAVDCIASNACDTIDCSLATSCDIECIGASACGDVICGTGRCTVECNGSAACDAVDCAQACECDVDCDGGMDCESASCPLSDDGNNLPCTDGTSAGCDSTPSECERTCP